MGLKEGDELFDRHLRAANEFAEGTGSQLFVLGHGEVGTVARLGHDEVAPNLANFLPASFSEGFAASLPEMLASVPIS